MVSDVHCKLIELVAACSSRGADIVPTTVVITVSSCENYSDWVSNNAFMCLLYKALCGIHTLSDCSSATLLIHGNTIFFYHDMYARSFSATNYTSKDRSSNLSVVTDICLLEYKPSTDWTIPTYLWLWIFAKIMPNLSYILVHFTLLGSDPSGHN